MASNLNGPMTSNCLLPSTLRQHKGINKWLFSVGFFIYILASTAKRLLALLFASVRAAHCVQLTGTDAGQLKSLRQTRLKGICLFSSVRSLGRGRVAPPTSPIRRLSALRFSLALCCCCGFPLSPRVFLIFSLSLLDVEVPPRPLLSGS